MIKLNQPTLDKLQELCTLAGYTVRHEKGNFRSGSCVVVTGKLIVLNKFSTVETRVTYLIDALRNLTVDESLLDQKRLNFLKEVREFSIISPETVETSETLIPPGKDGGAS